MASNPGLEITTILGCPVDCIYCPQDQIRLASKGNKHKILKLDDFKKIIANVPNNVKIFWTGYSEPCLNPQIEEMTDYAFYQGYAQTISTTLVGNQSSIESISQKQYFDSKK